MNRVTARREASICCAVIHARSRACRPNSPNTTEAPLCASPRIRPRCDLRYFTLLGINIGLRPPLHGHPRHPRGEHHGLARAAPELAGAAALRKDVPSLDPHPHPDRPVVRQARCHPKVDVRPERLEGDAAVPVPLVPGDLGPGEPAAARDPDALGPAPERAGDRLLHRAPVRHPPLELAGDVLRDERRLEFGPADLLHVELNLLAGQRVQFFLQGIDARSTPPDDDPGSRGVNGDAHPVGGALDLDARDAGAPQLLLDVAAQGLIFLDEVGEVLLGIPLRLPVLDDPEPQPDRMDLLPHRPPPYSPCTTMVMWLLRFLMTSARPRARACIRLWLGPLSTYAWETRSVSRASSRLFSALSAADFTTFATAREARLGENRRTARASSMPFPLMSAITGRTFRGAMRTYRATAFTSIAAPPSRRRRGGRRGRGGRGSGGPGRSHRR